MTGGVTLCFFSKDLRIIGDHERGIHQVYRLLEKVLGVRCKIEYGISNHKAVFKYNVDEEVGDQIVALATAFYGAKAVMSSPRGKRWEAYLIQENDFFSGQRNVLGELKLSILEIFSNPSRNEYVFREGAITIIRMNW